MDILDDMGVSKLSAKVFFKSETALLYKTKELERFYLFSGLACVSLLTDDLSHKQHKQCS